MKTKIFGSTLALLVMGSACKDTNKKPETRTEIEIGKKRASTDITLDKLLGSPEYSDASLSMVSPGDDKIGNPGMADFNFEVQNYVLGTQTAAENKYQLANSDMGQHIHMILDNQPYTAHYKPSFQKELPKGTHYLVAFLSRSYHESVKNQNAFVAKKIVVGEKSPDGYKVDLSEPTLIYSRPKGEYTGNDSNNVLLDFYLLNTRLSEQGNSVRATINGKVFKITEWAPYILKGLPMGETTIELELLDKDGRSIPGAFNKVERTIILKNKTD